MLLFLSCFSLFALTFISECFYSESLKERSSSTFALTKCLWGHTTPSPTGRPLDPNTGIIQRQIFFPKTCIKLFLNPILYTEEMLWLVFSYFCFSMFSIVVEFYVSSLIWNLKKKVSMKVRIDSIVKLATSTPS